MVFSVSSLLCLIFASLLKRSTGQTMEVTCSETDTVLTLDLEQKDFTFIPLYEIKRDAIASDFQCAGNIVLDGRPFADDYQLVSVAPKTFADLPNLESLSLIHNRFQRSTREMYDGSTRLETIDYSHNQFEALDDQTTLFPIGLKKLTVTANRNFVSLKKNFFEAHPSLTEIDLTNPEGVSAGSLTFESGLTQASSFKIRRFHIASMPFKTLERSLLANHSSTLTHVEMGNWRRLTAIEDNALGGLTLETLDVSDWRFNTIPENLFSGSSIANLIMQRISIKFITPGAFANIQNMMSLDITSGQFTAIDADTFKGLAPMDGFELSVSKDLPCCQTSGIFQLNSQMNGLIVNGNDTHYECLNPKEEPTTLRLDSEPSKNFVCCDFTKEYFDTTTEECVACKVPQFCIDHSPDNCLRENFICDTCDGGYFPFVNEVTEVASCAACTVPVNCTTPSLECNADGVAGCDACVEGYNFDSTTQQCSRCLEPAETSCVEFATSCIEGVLELQCSVCEKGSVVDPDTGRCSLSGNSVATWIIAVAAVAGVLIAIIAVAGGLRYKFVQRKKAKEAKLHKMMGIGSENAIEIEAVEFNPDTYSQENLHPIGQGEVNYQNINEEKKNVGQSEYANNGDSSEYANNVDHNPSSEYANSIDPGLAPDAPSAVREKDNGSSEYANHGINEYANNDNMIAIDVDNSTDNMVAVDMDDAKRGHLVESEYANHEVSEYANNV